MILIPIALFCLFLTVNAASQNVKKHALNQRQVANSNFVAFSAGLTHNEGLYDHVHIQFDKVWTNQGDGYDHSTGIFTCPLPGVYVFYYHGVTEKGGKLWLELYKNGVYEQSGFAHGSDNYAYASNSIVLPLIDGDQITILGKTTGQLFGDPKEIYATFSGYKLIPKD